MEHKPSFSEKLASDRVQRRLYPLLAPAVIVLIFRSFALGKFPGNGENWSAFPLKFLVAESLSNWSLPTWSKNLYTGYPLLAEPFSSAFYPVDWVLYSIFSFSRAYSLAVLLALVLSAVFTYLLARSFKLSYPAAAMASLTYALSGLSVSLLGPLIWVFPWLPLCLFFLQKSLTNIKYLSLYGVAIAIMITSGFVQIGIYVIIASILFYLYKIWPERRWGLLLGLFAVLLLALGLSAPAWLPVYEFLPQSSRAIPTNEFKTGGSYSPRLLITLFFPRLLLGNQGVLGMYIPLYIGLTPLFLSIYALLTKKLSGNIRLLLILFFVFLVLAMGGYTPLFKLTSNLPLIGNFRSHWRALIVSVLALSLLSAYGLDAIREKAKSMSRNKRAALAISALFFASALGTYLLTHLAPAQLKKQLLITPDQMIIFLLVVSITTVLVIRGHLLSPLIPFFLVLITAADLAILPISGRVIPPFSYDRYQPPGKLLSVLRADRSKPFRVASVYALAGQNEDFYNPHTFEPKIMRIMGGISTIYGFGNMNSQFGLTPGRHAHLYKALFKNEYITEARPLNTPSIKFLGASNAKYILSLKPQGDPVLPKPRKVSNVYLYENPYFLPRFSIFGKAKVLSPENTVKEIFSKDWDPKQTLLIEKSKLRAPNTSSSKSPNKGDLRISEYSDTEALLRTKVSGESWLLFSDTYDKGWRATVDGKNAHIFRANYLYKAILLKPGSHKIRFYYAPRILPIAFTVSAFSAFLLIGFFIWASLKGPQKSQSMDK